MIKLPDNIDYTKFSSTSGMVTKIWGAKAWAFLFTSIMGHYPMKIDINNTDHINLQKHFKHLLCSLSIIMPCIFCRESFKGFLKELPINEYLIGRMELMYWLYLMKDKVNNKLINQEKEAYNEQKRTLKKYFYDGKITVDQYYDKVNKCKNNSFKTTPTPPFQQVLEQYENCRANCSNKAKTCNFIQPDLLDL
jgi:hypothetical protein